MVNTRDRDCSGCSDCSDCPVRLDRPDFPNLLVVALAHSIKHLSAFGLADALRETRFFARFAARTHMLLAGNTLRNLEIYANETDGEVRGSLLWVLDRTQTKFGARLLRSWVGRPLIDKRSVWGLLDGWVWLTRHKGSRRARSCCGRARLECVGQACHSSAVAKAYA